MAGKGYGKLINWQLERKLNFKRKEPSEALMTAILWFQLEEEEARKDGRREWALEAAATAAALNEIKKQHYGAIA